jgi:ERCC4-type nuclease
MRGRERPYDYNFKLKAIDFPEGFVLLQDTREQRPLFSSKRLPSGLVIKSIALQDGDYSISGFEKQFAIERKGLSDLYSYCSSERQKTVAKMHRFAGFEYVGLVIEDRESEVLVPQQYSRVSPEVIRQSIVSFELRYNIHVYYNNDTNAIARHILDRAVKFYRIKHEV